MRTTVFSITATLLALAATSTTAHSAGHLSSGLQSHNQLAKRVALAAAPARSRHATRQHRDVSPSAKSSKKKSKRKSDGSLKKRKCSAPTKTPVKVSDASGSTDDGSDQGTVEDEQNDNGSGEGLVSDPGSEFLKINDIYVGFLPDDGSGGGKSETMAQINSMLPAPSAWFGRYAQVTNGKTFDGNQLYHVLDDVKASKGILSASVMPYKTWYGLTESDNRNAIAIAKVCNDIYVNHGVEVWLRFAHEMNWYCTDGTYAGGYDNCVKSFQTAWKLVAAAVKEHAPNTKMHWSPNVGSDNDYEKCYPKEGQVDVVGFDWYPNSASESFVDRAKPFYDKYAKDGIVMMQGETGLHYSGSIDEKMQWVKSLSSAEAKKQMPNYMGYMFFNYDKFENGKQIDFKIIKPNEDKSSGVNAAALSFFSA